jgi:hypothetical protein
MSQIPIYAGAECVFVKTGRGFETNDPWAHYWRHPNGAEGGELWLGNGGRIVDYDGAFDLPEPVYRELAECGYYPDYPSPNARFSRHPQGGLIARGAAA